MRMANHDQRSFSAGRQSNPPEVHSPVLHSAHIILVSWAECEGGVVQAGQKLLKPMLLGPIVT